MNHTVCSQIAGYVLMAPTDNGPKTPVLDTVSNTRHHAIHKAVTHPTFASISGGKAHCIPERPGSWDAMQNAGFEIVEFYVR